MCPLSIDEGQLWYDDDERYGVVTDVDVLIQYDEMLLLNSLITISYAFMERVFLFYLLF